MNTKYLISSFCLLPFAFCLLPSAFSQSYTRTDSIPVKVNGNWLKNPWVGGHNYVQLSDIDINFDGIKDLFVFDRTGHKITTYINGASPNTIDYYDSTAKYGALFPHLENWVLIRDYNCDGKPDIFTYSITVAGIKVWRNTSSGGNLQFTLQTPYIKSNYCPSVAKLYVSAMDIPTIDDVDGDGDLDVLTFDMSSTNVEYHINKSKELGYTCDSLLFYLDCSGGCWGNFQESSSNCSINLNACRMGNPSNTPPNLPKGEEFARASSPPLGELEGVSLHTGSCSLCLDMDADGDKEILIGDVSCCSMSLLSNGGSASSATIISKDTNFPSANIPVTLTMFPCGSFVDVNNDGKRDLIVAPNAPNVSVDNESIWYYENIAADNAPIFWRRKRSFLQEDMIDVGSGANPVFFDFDNDGLTDLLVSNYKMISDSCPSPGNSFGINAFRNIGTISIPAFELVTTNYANLSTQLPNVSGKHLTFGDLDNDGDADMFIGVSNGFIHYFTNTGGTGAALFTLSAQNYPTTTGAPIDVGNYATPQLLDADRDGDLDLIIGEQWGNLNYYKNIGTKAVPSFSLVTTSFGGVDVMKPCCTGYSVPFMYDSAGSYRLLVASEANRTSPATGQLWYYKNIDGNLAGNFTLVDSMYQNIWEGLRMTVCGKDITGDGRMDLVIGNYAGGAAIYMGNIATGVHELYNEGTFDFSIYPNPFSASATLRITNGKATNYELKLYDMYGKEVRNESIRNSEGFVIRRGNLLQGVYVCVVSGENFSKAKKLILLK